MPPKERSKRVDIEKQNQEILNEAIEFILQGYRYSEVSEYLTITHNLNVQQAKHFYDTAKVEIYRLGNFDLDMVITQHILYYEEAIRYFDEVGNYSAKASAMNAKEKLLKIFEDEPPAIEIENNIDLSISSEQLYDIKKLDSKEQERFDELFVKIKRINDFSQ